MPATLKKAYAAALLQTLIIGFSFVFAKVTLRYAAPLDILAHRFSLSLLAACVPLFLGFVKLQINWKRDLPSILLLALFYPSLFFSLQIYGLAHTSTSEAGIVQAMAPIFTAVMAATFLKERIGGRVLAMILLSVGGVCLIFVMQGLDLGAGNLLGNILILLSALSLSAYSVLARKISQKHDIFSMTFIMILIAAVVFNLLAVGDHLLHGDFAAFTQPLGNWQFIGSLLYLGILSSLLTAYLSNYALSKIQASRMSLFFNLATLTTIFAGVLLLDERLHWYHIVGGAAILIGLVGSNLGSSANAKPAR